MEILNEYRIASHNDSENIGIWVKKNNLEYKIAAIGIKVKKWVAYHGFALNLDVEKSSYDGIIPCGISSKGIINFSEIQTLPSEDELNQVILNKFKKIFTV